MSRLVRYVCEKTDQEGTYHRFTASFECPCGVCGDITIRKQGFDRVAAFYRRLSRKIAFAENQKRMIATANSFARFVLGEDGEAK